MAPGARELVDRVAIPVEPEPAHPVEDRVDRGLGGAGAVGILDAQQELAAVVAREQPVEQRGARAADMEETRRRRREARDDAGNSQIGRAACRERVWQYVLIREVPVSLQKNKRKDV